MAIIDSSYFEKGDLYIPNNKDISVEPTDSPSSQSELDFFIEEYERELLLNALGVVLYGELETALLDLPNADQKWKDLVDGTTYIDPNGNNKIWEGLKGYNGKRSLIAYYVFTEYLRNDNETYSTVGTVKNDAKNATNVGATPKFIKAYNKFLEAYQGDLGYQQPTMVMNAFGTVGFDWYGTEKPQVSLYRFLSDSNELDETAFPDFEFKFYEHQNSFGI